MKIAIVGSGISGMGAALALNASHDVTLFEAQDRFGGHANTAFVSQSGRSIPVDTGFIVYNYHNYPNLTGLFEHLGVETKWSDMSFGMSLSNGKFEIAFDSLDKVFAQRSNALKPNFHKYLREILRFNATAAEQLDAGELDDLTLAEWAAKQGYSTTFRDKFLLPMGGAIWSTPTRDIMSFPARNFVSFFRNHDLMTGLSPARRWRTVEGGSINYVSKLIEKLGKKSVCGAEIVAVERKTGKPNLTFRDGSKQEFDQVILAVHAPVAFRLLSGKSDLEARLLSRFRTSENLAILHSDQSLMPKRKKVWSSWNFLTEDFDMASERPAPVTYWMNRLQSLPQDKQLFVSLNPSRTPDAQFMHNQYTYHHPMFEAHTFKAQADLDAIQGQGGVWYAGAWLGYGFHEDGLASGLRAAMALGAEAPWIKSAPEPFVPYLEAAE